MKLYLKTLCNFGLHLLNIAEVGINKMEESNYQRYSQTAQKHFLKCLWYRWLSSSYHIILNVVQTRFYFHHSTKTLFISVTNDLHVTKCHDQFLVSSRLSTSYNWLLLLFSYNFLIHIQEHHTFFPLSHWLLLSNSSSSAQTLNIREP